jgi:hypothetical protein
MRADQKTVRAGCEQPLPGGAELAVGVGDAVALETLAAAPDGADFSYLQFPAWARGPSTDPPGAPVSKAPGISTLALKPRATHGRPVTTRGRVRAE